ncbi:MAG: hypothetical protein SOX32_08960 [Candidatus Choladocola sp.]|nr:hypothetical protein [Candidatus Choladocola sp.]
MRRGIKAATTFVMSTICMGAFPLCGQAGIYVSDSDIILETEDETWKEISDKYTLHTFTNGTDVITVLKYGKDEELPGPVKTGEKYEAVYQTIYSTGDETYIVTGSAVRAEDICGVKEVIDSIVYPDMESDIENSITNAAHDGIEGITEEVQLPENETELVELQPENDIYPGEDVVELVNLKGDTTTVYKLSDGRYMDRIDRIFIFDGVDTWTDEEGVEWNETVK